MRIETDLKLPRSPTIISDLTELDLVENLQINWQLLKTYRIECFTRDSIRCRRSEKFCAFARRRVSKPELLCSRTHNNRWRGAWVALRLNLRSGMKVKHKELPHNYVPEMMRLINLFSASTSSCACVFFLLTQAQPKTRCWTPRGLQRT